MKTERLNRVLQKLEAQGIGQMIISDPVSIFYLTGWRCPTCGVTRAILSLARLDVKGYFEYHPLAIPLVISVLLMIHVKHVAHPWRVYSFVAVTLLLNTGVYVVRLFF